jgi:6-phosphogluconolactonase
MIEVAWRSYDTPAEMADAVAAGIGSVIASAVAERGAALVAFPGGRSPARIFERLSEMALPWDRVTIVPTDERLVPAESPLSNVGKIARHFLPKGARLLPMVAGNLGDYRRVGEAADAKLGELRWPLDLAWLGVGADGHTASIFPGPDLEEALNGASTRKALGVLPDPLPAEAPVARVTLSRAAIQSARTLLLTLSGKEKYEVVKRAVAEGAESAMPLGRVLAKADTPIYIHWSAT